MSDKDYRETLQPFQDRTTEWRKSWIAMERQWGREVPLSSRYYS
ncbi:hypothetical protein CSUI_009727 [Cystoisospora suis]|uniref:Uncharacterized protein n=1 Tax=Cystoisospora suis TaxID=483139 RepID=A0A2C6KFZ9_9APIC|nr:hypothetical protein CSUI_009727 [Cystoisospora suis]